MCISHAGPLSEVQGLAHSQRARKVGAFSSPCCTAPGIDLNQGNEGTEEPQAHVEKSWDLVGQFSDGEAAPPCKLGMFIVYS